eukprot:gene3661-6476_t
MNDISVDILYQICTYLPLNDFENFFATSKNLNEVSKSELLWKEIYTTRFSNDPILTKTLNIETFIKKAEPSNYKEFVKKILIRKQLPSVRKEILKILKKQNYTSYASVLYKLSYKTSDSLWFERTIYTSHIYKSLFETFSISFPNEIDEIYTLKLIDLLHEKNSIQFKEFENTFQIIFRIKNQKLFKHIKSMLIKELLSDLYNVTDLLFSALQHDVHLDIVKAIIKNRRKELLIQQHFLADSIENSSVDIVKYLVKCGFKLENQLIDPIIQICSISNTNIETLNKLKYLLSLTFEVNCRDRYGRTPLILLCLKNQNEFVTSMINLLLNYGAKVNERDDDSHTALFYLEKNETMNIQAQTLLMKNGGISS